MTCNFYNYIEDAREADVLVLIVKGKLKYKKKFKVFKVSVHGYNIVKELKITESRAGQPVFNFIYRSGLA